MRKDFRQYRFIDIAGSSVSRPLGDDENIVDSNAVNTVNRFLDKMVYKERRLSPFSVYP